MVEIQDLTELFIFREAHGTGKPLCCSTDHG